MNKLNTRIIAYDILYSFFRTQKSLKNIFNKKINDSICNQRDLKFITELVYGSVRYFHKSEYLIKKYCKKYPDIKSLTILSLSLYQLFKMNSVPNYAAVDTTVELCKKIDFSKVKLINALMRKLSDNMHLKASCLVLALTFLK